MTFYYKGMRWLKCDLQMQTPADARHWAGDRLEAGQEAAAAKAFAEACYEKGLDVVGITDHNFLSKDFIPHLQTAFDEIDREFSHKITLFPGFEFEAAGVGRGVHVLCLFEPGTDLTRLDSILTECGVSYPRVNAAGQLEKSDKNLKEILRITQDKYGGIVIMPHATSNDGIFDNDSIAEWLQQDQFTNPDLLAVEVPKPVQLMSAGYQRFSVLVTIVSQAGSAFAPLPHSCLRTTRSWSTSMSIRSRRLTALATGTHGSKCPSPPSNRSARRSSTMNPASFCRKTFRQIRTRHSAFVRRPRSISIKNVAFLADQQVHFSPNMNCVIGGRGSGKSTLLEYLRIILGKDKSKDLDYGTKERIKRVRDTLNEPRAEVEVCWVSADGVEDRIVWQNGSPTVQGRDLADPETFFNSLPLRFYSQQQLNRLTESKTDDGSVRQAQRLLELVDGFTKNELDELADREHKLKLQIQDAFSNLRKAKTLEKDYKRLQQEHQELDRQWKARSEIQEDARRHQLLKAEARYLEGLAGTPGKQFTDVATLAETIAASHVAFQATDSAHAAWFRQFDDKVKAAKDSLARTIREAVERFEIAVEDLKTNDPAWNAIREELDQADAKFSEACAAKGLTTDDVGHLQEINQSRAKKQREIDETGAEIQRLKEAAGDTGLLMQQLHQIWRDQFQKRVEAAERANELAVLNEGRQRFIEVSAKYQQDHKNFRELWQSFAPSDGRTRLGKNWESCGETLYTLFTGQEDAESPWQVLEERLSVEQGSTGPDFGSNSQELIPAHSRQS